MRIFEKAIASLLVICMMFSSVPVEMLTQVYAGGDGDTGTHSSAGRYTDAAGAMILGHPIVRVTLSRDEAHKYNGTSAMKENIRNTYNTRYPKRADWMNCLMFVDTRSQGGGGDWNDLNYKISQAKNSGGKLYFGTYQFNAASLNSGNPVQGRTHVEIERALLPTTPKSTAPKNVFQEKALNAKRAKTIASTDELANFGWKNYLPTVDQSRALCEYLFNSTEGFQSRVEKVTCDYFYELDKVDTYTDEQKFTISTGFAGILVSLYQVASIEGCTTLAARYETAINDYLGNENTMDKPVSLVIDTCIEYHSLSGTRDVFIVPCMDVIEASLMTESDFSFLAGDTFTKMTGGAAYSSRTIIGRMANESLKRYPFSGSYGNMQGYGEASTKKWRRLADSRTGPVPAGVLNTLMGSIIRHPQFSGGNNNVIRTGDGHSFWHGKGGDSGFYGVMTLDGTSLAGFMILGYIMTNPIPDVYYEVSNSLGSSSNNCNELEVKPQMPATITLNIGQDSGMLSALESLKDNKDGKITFTREIYRTVYQDSYGNVIEPRTKMPTLEAEIKETYTYDEFLNIMSGNPIVIKDMDVMSKTYMKKELAAQDILFQYEINLKIKIDEAEYEFKNDDIVLTEGAKKLDTAIYHIKPYATEVSYPPDIVITPPAKDNNPSEKEDLKNNRQMIRRYEYASVNSEEDNATIGAFAEVKSNEPLKEEWEVMGGIPSSEEIYFSVGGTEFKVALVLQYWMNEHSRDRTYTMHFDSNLCEYNNQQKGKGDSWEGIDLPKAAGASQTTTRFEHAASSSVNYDGNTNPNKYGTITVTATWTGSVPNDASAVTALHSATCVAQPNHSDYLAAVAQANAWMSAMAALTPNLKWTAASDKQTRSITIDAMNIGNGGSNTAPGASGGADDDFADRTCINGTVSASFSNPATTTDSKSCSKSSTSPCGNEMATANPDGPGSYTITVTYNISPHTLCGPCCEHVLPDLYDTWKQGLVYDFVKIAQIRLYELNQGSAKGFEELIGTDQVFANVVSGNPTYFMNIAQQTENKRPHYVVGMTSGALSPDIQRGLGLLGTFANTHQPNNDGNGGISGDGRNRQEAQSSRAGRIRYLLDPTQKSDNPQFAYSCQGAGTSGSFTLTRELVANPKQHDDVIYTVQQNNGKRSMNCDGMGTTGHFGKSSTENSIPMDNTGHSNEWADGCLYANILKVDDYSSYYYTNTSLGVSYQPLEMEANDKRAFNNNTTGMDGYREDFDHHRTVVGTKSQYDDTVDDKDMATAEWQWFNAARNTKIIADVISDFLIMQTSGGDQSIFYFEKATLPTPAQVHFQKLIATEKEMFDGNELSIFKSGCSGGMLKEDIVGFEIVGGYNGRYDVPAMKYRPYQLRTKQFLNFGGEDGTGFPNKYSATFDDATFQTKQKGNYDPLGNSKIITIFDKTGPYGGDPAKTISRPLREATDQDNSFKILQKDIQIIPTAPNQYYQPNNGLIWYSQVDGFYSLDEGVIDLEIGANRVGCISNVAIGAPQRAVFADVYKEHWGHEAGVEFNTKYFLRADGDSNTLSVNGVIVHTPVSVEDAIVLPQGDFNIEGKTISRDQRVNAFDYPDMNDLVNKLKVCPLDPGTCEYRVLDCKYLHDTVLAQFDFAPTYETTEEDSSGDYEHNRKPVTKPNTYKNDEGRWVTTNKITGTEYILPAGYTIKSGGFGNGEYLSATGNESWSISFADLGLSNARSNRVKVSMNLRVNGTGNLMVVSFKNTGFIIDDTAKGRFIQTDLIETNRVGSTKKLNKTVSNVKLEVIYSFNNIIDCTAYVNGVECGVEYISDYREQWKETTSNGQTVRTKYKTDVTLTAEELVENPPRDIAPADLGTRLNIGNWTNGKSNFNANYDIDNLEITLLGGTTEHTSACYTTKVFHATKYIHVCDANCYLKEDKYTCDGHLNDNYQLNCNNLPLNSHTCDANCKQAVTFTAKADYYYRSHYDTQNITGYVVTLGSYSYIWPGSGNLVYTYGSQCGRDYNMPSSVLHSNASSGYTTLQSTSYPGSSGHSTIVYAFKLTNGLTISGGKIYVNKCPGTLNTHVHIGVGGVDYPNGCYTKPTEHTHNMNEKTLICPYHQGGDGLTYTFNYTGDIQSVKLPRAAKWLLETWGAQGGSASTSYVGGKGGYAKGYYTTTGAKTLYVYVGQQGQATAGGWNGGGAGASYPGGGGKTHISTGNQDNQYLTITNGQVINGYTIDTMGQTVTLVPNTKYSIIVHGGGCSYSGKTHLSLPGGTCSVCGHSATCGSSAIKAYFTTGTALDTGKVLIVAGGGGGSGHTGTGGAGGGTSGSNATYVNGTYGIGGTQSAAGYGGAIGMGGTGYSHGGGGGGGYYGGGGGYDCSGGGGGGSGYIGGVTGGSMTNGSRTGNGYARITEKEHVHTASCFTTTKITCDFVPKGSHQCTGVINTESDFNTHKHTAACLTTVHNLPPKTFDFTGTEQRYLAPYTDYYRIEVYGPATVGGQAGYATAVVRLDKNDSVYVYPGNSTYNGGFSDVRWAPKQQGANTNVDGNEAINQDINDASDASRFIIAGGTKESCSFNNNVAHPLTEMSTETRGGSINGWVVITPLNRLPQQNFVNDSLLEDIMHNLVSEADMEKYLGSEVMDLIRDENGNIPKAFTSKTFNYTGNRQSVTLPKGKYLFEAWGAQGGGQSEATYESHGGLGGYTKGTVSVGSDTTYYVYVGGQGTLSSGLGTGAGWNGGGHGGLNGYGGGGMTHITTSSTDSFSPVYGPEVHTTVTPAGTETRDVTYLARTDGGSWNSENNTSWTVVRSFTVSNSGTLRFYSTSSAASSNSIDPVARIRVNGNIVSTDDDGGSGYNFDLSASVKAGDVVSYEVSSYRQNESATIPVTLVHPGITETTTVYVVKQNNSFNTGAAIIVAGGGGGADNINYEGSVVGGADDGSGGAGGGLVAGNASLDGIVGYGDAIFTADSGLSLRTGTTKNGSSAVTNAAEEGVYGPYKAYPVGQRLRITVSGSGLTNGYPIVYTNYGHMTYPVGNITTIISKTANQCIYEFTVPAGLTVNSQNTGSAYTSADNPYKIWEFCYHASNSNAMTIDSVKVEVQHDNTRNNGGKGMGGNTSKGIGYGRGYGESVIFATDTGGGGGGWYGGWSTNSNNGGAGGGSGYYNTSKVTGGSTTAGKRKGNGVAKITAIEVGLDESVRKTIVDNFDLIPDYVDGDVNPIWLCKLHPVNAHVCTKVDENGNELVLCDSLRMLDCEEPHHRGIMTGPDGQPMKDDYGNPICREHYAGSNKICWSACENDDNHKNTKKEVVANDGTGDKLYLAEYLQIDEGFTVYFPNIGDFRGNNALGLAAPQVDRGYGYKDRMETTRWTREKRVKFPFDVIFEEIDGTQHIYKAHNWIELDVPTEYFNFYLLVENFELANASVEFECEAINCATTEGLEPFGGISYSDNISTVYVDALKVFVENTVKYINKYSSDGYLMPKANPGGNNSAPATIPYGSTGFEKGYQYKSNTEEQKLRNAMGVINRTLEDDFEGDTNDRIDPHNRLYTGINEELKPLTENDNKIRVNNKLRKDSFQSLHGGYKHFYLDVIGRIGNFAIVDTEDFRFSNFFKVPVVSEGDTAGLADPNNWLVDGLVLHVDDGIQNFYVGDTYDLRGNKATPNTRWLDTYGTESWMTGTYIGGGARDMSKPNLVSQILTGEINNIEVLKQEELRYGYDAYTSLVTFGSYDTGLVQVVPKYYALKTTDRDLANVPPEYNVPKGTYVPVDVYIDKDGIYAPVNVFGNAGNGNPNKANLVMNDYVFNLDWTDEDLRRNYTLEEKARTLRVKEAFKQTIYDIDEETGEFDPDSTPILDIIEYITPEGKTNYIGTSQYILMDSKHRTFIGSSNTYDGNAGGKHIWNSRAGSMTLDVEKNIQDALNPALTQAFEDIDFERAVQRWHGKLGLPSSSVFVPHNFKSDELTEVTTESLNWIQGDNEDDWLIVCTAETIAIGSVWSLYYSQPWFDRMTINGVEFKTSTHYPGHRVGDDENSVECPDCLPPIIAVFGKTSVDDVEIIQTH